MDKMQNFVVGDIVTAPSPASSGTTIEVESKENFPNPSTFGEYNLVLWNKEGIPDTSNCEIVRVTSISVVNSTLTELNITRAQEGTTAKTITTSWRAYLSPTKKYFDDLKTYIDQLQLEKASGSDINTGTNDSKFVTPKSIADSWIETGWIPARETWEYASVDNPTGVFTISGDVSSKYSTGMRLKMTNGGNTIYGIITAVSYSSPNTSITFLHEINPSNSQALNLMANSAITNPFYSTQKTPSGFPSTEDKWRVFVEDLNDRTTTSYTASTYLNPGSLVLSVPIGSWKLGYRGTYGGRRATDQTGYYHLGLSTSSNSLTMSDTHILYGAYGTSRTPVEYYFSKSYSSKTNIYLILWSGANCEAIQILGDYMTTIISATCAYL